MKITATNFDFNYHTTERHGGTVSHSYYTRHTVDVYNEITIEEDGKSETLNATYQTGCSYIANDYNLPSPELEISEEGGASRLLGEVSRMYASDFDDKEKIQFVLDEIAHEIINTPEKLRQLYDFLIDNHPGDASDFVDEEFRHLLED